MRHRHGPGFSDALAGGPALLEPVSVIVTYATLRVTRILAGAVVVEVPGGAVPPAFAPLRFRPEVDPAAPTSGRDRGRGPPTCAGIPFTVRAMAPCRLVMMARVRSSTVPTRPGSALGASGGVRTDRPWRGTDDRPGSPRHRRQLIADKYRIERMVGEGGFAVVYRAEHVVWQRPVAVKLFNGLAQAPVESRDALQRDFIREGALLTELSSQTAGIVQAWDVGTYATPGGQWMPYMVLEWLEGSPLDAVLEQDQAQRMTWTEAEVLGFLARILPILEVAHRRGIAHRDIKPPTSSSWAAPRAPRALR
jgi:hypothetical protein